ncbi:MAG: hypothetical protein IT319_10910 [Anaerolineae bacterium]|nr:hypothetical protein [Anaerolineae bacterium]
MGGRAGLSSASGEQPRLIVFPFLSLEDVDLDIELAKRLSRRLAYYHLAFPVAQDGEWITVVMAYPENGKVISVLEAVLGARIIPVRGYAEAIRHALNHIWHTPQAAGVLRVIHWARSVNELESSSAYVAAMLDALERDSRLERAVSETLAHSDADLVIVASAGAYNLKDLFRTQASLLIVHDPLRLPRKVLHVLRGHIPDHRVLDWLIPLAQRNHSEITLLMGVDEQRPVVSELSALLMAQDERQTHIAECRRTLSEMNIAGRLKLRQDTLLNAVREELAEKTYDLVAIAAEAYGDFAYEVGMVVGAQTPAFLVVKP